MCAQRRKCGSAMCIAERQPKHAAGAAAMTERASVDANRSPCSTVVMKLGYFISNYVANGSPLSLAILR